MTPSDEAITTAASWLADHFGDDVSSATEESLADLLRTRDEALKANCSNLIEAFRTLYGTRWHPESPQPRPPFRAELDPYDKTWCVLATLPDPQAIAHITCYATEAEAVDLAAKLNAVAGIIWPEVDHSSSHTHARQRPVSLPDRDPRTDPKAGDVLLVGDYLLTVKEIEDGFYVKYKAEHAWRGYGLPVFRELDLSGWRQTCAKNAHVIEVAP